MKIITVATIIISGLMLLMEKNSLNAGIPDNIKHQENIHSDTLAAIVNVRFMVNKSGQVQNVRALSVECDHCDKKLKKQLKKEAVKVVSSMPEWTSDEGAKGKNVWFVLPMRMVLKNHVIKN
jgi:hypothetical protein